jgi:anti-anti-sigma regulatory factor
VGESQERAQTIRITGLSDHFHKIFDMVGLTRYIKIFPSEEAALKDF